MQLCWVLGLDAIDALAYAIPAGMLALGAAVLMAGLLRTLRKFVLVGRGRITQGVVVRSVEERRKKAVRYFAEVRFRPEGAEADVEFRSALSTDAPVFADGQTVEVRYWPQQPSRAEVHEFWHLWFWPIFLVGLGLVIMALGGWILHGFLVALGN